MDKENEKEDLVPALLQMLRVSWMPLLVLLTFYGVTQLSFLKIPVIWTAVLFFVFAVPLIASSSYKAMRRRNLGTDAGNRFFSSKAFSELNYGAKQLRPFIFFGLCLALAPLTVLFMFVHWVSNTFGLTKKKQVSAALSLDSLVLHQNKPRTDASQTSFFSSSQFSPTILAIFALGIPAAVVILLYHLLGVGGILEQANTIELIPFDTRGSFAGSYVQEYSRHVLLSTKTLEQAAYGFTPKANFAHFATYVYMMSLAWCMAVLFFRAYFTFPLHFASTEYDVELNKKGVTKHAVKGWFAELVWYTWPGFLPTQIPWDKLDKVEFVQGGIGRLSPLPTALFEKETFIYKGLNRLAIFTDAVIDKMGRTEYLQLVPAGGGGSVKINLWELNDEEKASVFYSIRKWAPLVTMDAKVQEKLLGSTIMQEARYTQIWFDLLINQKQNMKEQSLNEGDCLQEGKYKILSRIGRGGQAQVYLASRQVEGEPEQNLVLKEFILSDSDSLAALLESASDFERESSILGRLSHANIVKMEEIFAENRRAYLVLEYVEGISLREHVRKYGNLSEEKTLDLALAMTDILQYLHQQDNPITHCDFSPDNILLRSDGSIKLIDFSIASTAATVNTNCLGKHAYIPPEQFRSTPCPQSDIYALGATLYFLLTGQDPKPITCSDPRSVNAGISEAIASIVKKSTTLDLKDRYSDIEWLRMDLLSAQSTAPPSESEGIAISIATKELENA